MLSTITNPILYGWLNTNLKHLFRALIPNTTTARPEHGTTNNHKKIEQQTEEHEMKSMVQAHAKEHAEEHTLAKDIQG